VNWRHFRQQGFLTVAIVLASAGIASTFFPFLDLREALILIAILALMIGWIP
jgi:uncharacterized membrane protein YdbT with pleckstrin-like domain